MSISAREAYDTGRVVKKWITEEPVVITKLVQDPVDDRMYSIFGHLMGSDQIFMLSKGSDQMAFDPY